MATKQTLGERFPVRMTATPVDRNPNMEDAAMNHYRVTLTGPEGTMRVTYSRGLGLEPGFAVDEVLNCLASDAAGYVNANGFANWCAEYGYDTDSRKAERTYKAIERQANSLQRILGEQAYDDLLWHSERD